MKYNIEMIRWILRLKSKKLSTFEISQTTNMTSNEVLQILNKYGKWLKLYINGKYINLSV